MQNFKCIPILIAKSQSIAKFQKYCNTLQYYWNHPCPQSITPLFLPSYPPSCQNLSYNDVKRLNESNPLSIHPQSITPSFSPSLQIPSYNETELSVKLKTEIDSGNKLKILSRHNQDEITRLNKLRDISEAMIVSEKKNSYVVLK